MADSCTTGERQNASARYVVVGGLTFLAALALRDSITTVWDRVTLRGVDLDEHQRALRKNFYRLLFLKLLFFIIIIVSAISAAVWWTYNQNCQVI